MIVVECYADELLIRRLGFGKKQICHARSKGEVIKRINHFPFAIGLIDQDPGNKPPREMNNYEVINRLDTAFLMEWKGNNKYLIQLNPRLEEWLLKRAESNDIKPSDFSLPNDGEELHRLTKVGKNNKYIAFLDKVIESDSEINQIKSFIEEKMKASNQIQADGRKRKSKKKPGKKRS